MQHSITICLVTYVYFFYGLSNAPREAELRHAALKTVLDNKAAISASQKQHIDSAAIAKYWHSRRSGVWLSKDARLLNLTGYGSHSKSSGMRCMLLEDGSEGCLFEFVLAVSAVADLIFVFIFVPISWCIYDRICCLFFSGFSHILFGHSITFRTTLSMLFILLLQVLSVNAGFQDAMDLLRPRDVAGSCSYVAFAIDFCEGVSPGFDNLATSLQAPCLCYSSSSWAPSIFDDAIKTCADFASTADPENYSDLAHFEGFCTFAGDVLKTPAAKSASTTSVAAKSTPSSTASVTTAPPTTSPPTTSPPSTASSVALNSNPGCSFVSFAFSYCNSVSPGFSKFDLTSQAPCLCYSSTSWAPQSFDVPLSSCADFVKTASPPAYSGFSELEGFCTVIGDVLATTGGDSSKTGGVLSNALPSATKPTSAPANTGAANTPTVVTKTAGNPAATGTAAANGMGSRQGVSAGVCIFALISAFCLAMLLF